MTQLLSAIATSQDGLVTRFQALTELTVGELRARLSRSWAIILPGVYATFRSSLTHRQRCRAALLYAGDDAQLADVTAAARYGVRYLPPTQDVHVLIPAQQHRLSRGFVVVRRTHWFPEPRELDGLRYCPPARALVEAAARIGHQATAHAFLADAVTRRVVNPADLTEAVERITGRGAGVARRAVLEISSGARSAPEVDFLKLCRTSTIVPPPLVNPLLELPDGRLISPDALFPGTPLVHEVNGRAFHADEDQFESMQERHDVMTAVGLTALHNSPRRIRRDSGLVLSEVERCYVRLEGQGLPPGVRIVRAHAA
jgi:hypothetical protein